MKNMYVPYEIALLAKENGFTEPCQCCYDKLNMLSSYGKVFEYKNYNSSGYCISAPLYQQIIDWFREKHSIDIVYNPPIGFEVWNYSKDIICFVQEKTEITYYEALNKAIEEAFKLNTINHEHN